jgi:hypothetical protein
MMRVNKTEWENFTKSCSMVTSTGLFPGDIVIVPKWMDPIDEPSFRLVISNSRGHTQSVIQFLYMNPTFEVKTETYLPHKQWYILAMDEVKDES